MSEASPMQEQKRRKIRGRRTRVAVTALALLALAGSDVATATPMPLGVSGRLAVRIGPTTAFQSAPLSGVVETDTQARTIALPDGLLATSGSLSGVTPAVAFTVTNAAAVLRPGGATTGTCPGPLSGAGACVLGSALGGGLGGIVPLLGTLALGTGSSAVVLPASIIGAGGIVSSGGVVFQGAPWTARTAAVTTTGPTMSWTTAMGAAPASWLGYLGNAASRPLLPLNLVTPVHVALGGGGHAAVFVTLELRAVPEPGSALLVAVGLAGLAIARRRHHRAGA